MTEAWLPYVYRRHTSKRRIDKNFERFKEEVEGEAKSKQPTGSGYSTPSRARSARKQKAPAVIVLSNYPAELLDRMKTLAASAVVDNTSLELQNETSAFLDRLLDGGHTDRGLFKALRSCFT